MKKLAVMKFDNEEQIKEFLNNHEDVKLLDKKVGYFFVPEIGQKKEQIEARFTSENDKLLLTSLERYNTLSDEAKKIIDSVGYSKDGKVIKLRIGQSFNDITISPAIYHEVFNFATDNGLKYFRHEDSEGEFIEFCLDSEGIVCWE